MITTVFNFLQGAVEFSLLGCAEAASLAFLLYLLYAKTRIVK
ncbi:hypothetical protein FF38_12809 [Lucilia cuprina]|uniref:Uncharacterized protein n=1 Tax=Lucilia cuprina TaxID=7375 RepID=A0A0L0CH10_LUCCU|nr:hypothetical protein FF38_12809 [Lucilia cuprina]